MRVALLETVGSAGALWPAAATLAVVVVRDRRREHRRRRRLNEHLHELRRPLQALALAGSAHRRSAVRMDPLELAMHALRDLDRAVNGGEAPTRRCAIDAREMVAAAASRWRGRAARSARPLRVRWLCGAVLVEGDPARLAQALDNLIANALTHGRGPITLTATARGDGLRVSVRDAGGPAVARPREAGPRHGHGLAIADRIAAGHGGSVRLRRLATGTVAALDLPLVRESRVRG